MKDYKNNAYIMEAHKTNQAVKALCISFSVIFLIGSYFLSLLG